MYTPFDTVSQVLEKYEDAFFDVVTAKLNLLRLKRKKMIADNLNLISRIKNVDNEDAKELLCDLLTCMLMWPP